MIGSRKMEKHMHIIEEVFTFMKSRVIITAAELDFFTNLDERPATSGKLASSMGLNPRATARILDALVTMDLLEKKGDFYHCTENGKSLSSRHPHTILPMILHMARLWKSWSYLTETVQEGSMRKREIQEFDDENRAAFIGAMHAIGIGLSEEIAEGYDLSPFKRMLDVGGASGTYTIAFLRKNLHMNATIFDLEPVISLALKRIEGEGLSDRVTFAKGDFYKDDLPGEYDLVLLSAIIHQNSPEENMDLFQKTFQALEPGGVLLIRDHIMDESRTKPPAGAMFAINMLVNTRGGDTYTFGEVQHALETAGFTHVALVRTGERMDCLVEARKPYH
ncbi:MAG: hypothetical protein C0392_03050 [Syntrophus sp. (in: bacteria)]|nr:hypothetical protein [Syntrophus sp. (in: bacteria)]